ncbi:hypothetical protein K502DRAFT_324977, partial [Neoconidiobolus thromboides FSU 785]
MYTNANKENYKIMNPYDTTPLIQDGTPLMYDFDGTPLLNDLNGTPMMHDFETPLLKDQYNINDLGAGLFDEQPLFNNGPSLFADYLMDEMSKGSSGLDSFSKGPGSLNQPSVGFNSQLPLIEPLISPSVEFNHVQVPPLFSPHLSQPLNTPV